MDPKFLHFDLFADVQSKLKVTAAAPVHPAHDHLCAYDANSRDG
jgi:hypothetical protein